MTPRSGRARLAAGAALGAAAAYAAAASGARPFTVAADVAVSVPSALFAATLLAERLRPEKGPWRRIERGARQPRGAAGAWLAVIGLVACVELASYFHGGARSAYPTLSSGLDALFRQRATRAAGWFGWIAAGWFLARR